MLRDFEKKFQYLKAPAKALTEAYEKGTRYFDQMKELILIEHGLQHTSDMFHRFAHWCPGQFDVIGDILHQRHVVQDYGTTPEFPGVVDSMEDIFRMALNVMNEIEQRLREMIKACDENGDPALGRQFENLQIELSKKHTAFLTAWKMLDETDSASSFDSWVLKMEEGAL